MKIQYAPQSHRVHTSIPPIGEKQRERERDPLFVHMPRAQTKIKYQICIYKHSSQAKIDLVDAGR